MLNSSDPSVLLWSLKPSEEGIVKGLITRFWNVANKPATSTLTTTLPIRQAWQTTHIETNERVLTPTRNQVQVKFAPTQLNTYRLQLAN